MRKMNWKVGLNSRLLIYFGSSGESGIFQNIINYLKIFNQFWKTKKTCP